MDYPDCLVSPCEALSAWIQVDDTPLTVYRTKAYPELARVVGNIESGIGKRYKVRMQVPPTTGDPDYPTWEVRLRIDGRYCGGRRANPDPVNADMEVRIEMDGMQEPGGLSSFLFGDVKLNEEAENVLQENERAELGTIQVEFVRIKVTKEERATPIGRRPVGAIGTEDKKIRVGALTKYGPVDKSKRCYSCYDRITHPSDAEKPFVTMVFYYMPMELLKQLDKGPEPVEDTAHQEPMEEIPEAQRVLQEKRLKLEEDLAELEQETKAYYSGASNTGKKRSAWEIEEEQNYNDEMKEFALRLKKARMVDGNRVDLTLLDSDED